MNITVANAADGESSDPSSDDTPVKILTEIEKSNSTSDINVATKIVPEAQALPSDTVTEIEKVVQTVDTKSNESSAVFQLMLRLHQILVIVHKLTQKKYLRALLKNSQ